MPFSAEVRKGGEWKRVDITLMDTPKVELLGYEVRCPDEDCHAPLIVKHGAVIAPHFAHKQVNPACIFSGGGGESQDHIAAKQAIINRLRNSRLYRGAAIDPERILRDGAVKRIADVFVTFPDGTTEVHEAQLSKTTVAETQERSDTYRALGVDTVIWWFGRANSGDTSLQQWALRDGGLVGTLDFTMQRVTVEG